MRRAPLVVLALLLIAAAPASAQEPPALAASLAACETGATPEQRFAVFTASMPAAAGTRRMAIRFDLQERRSDSSRFRRLSARKFGRWDRSGPGVGGFVYTKRVKRLEQGRWYRAMVRFRWLDRHGRVQRRARRATAACHQPDPRANLELISLGAVRLADRARLRYLVTVVNTGLTAAPASLVSLEPRPESVAARAVPPLAAGERTTVAVEAERCRKGSVVLVQLDAAREVPESREDDNRVRSDCPVPSDRG